MQHLDANNPVEPARFLTGAVGVGGGTDTTPTTRTGSFNVVNTNATTTSNMTTTTTLIERRLRPHHPLNLNCPRCDSPNTKFCYFNNYNQSQPRHFCKSCRRYWTRGGVLRNVPVGGGSRKSKRSSSKSSSSSTTATTRTTNCTDSSQSKPAKTKFAGDRQPSIPSMSSRSSSDSSSLTAAATDDILLANSNTTTAAEPDQAVEIHPNTTDPSLIPFMYPYKFGDFPSSPSYQLPKNQEQHEIKQDDNHRHIFGEVNEMKLPDEIVGGGLIMDHPHHGTVPLPLDLPPLFDSRLNNSGTADLGGHDHWHGYLDTAISFFDPPGNHPITGDHQPLFWNHSLNWGETP